MITTADIDELRAALPDGWHLMSWQLETQPIEVSTWTEPHGRGYIPGPQTLRVTVVKVTP